MLDLESRILDSRLENNMPCGDAITVVGMIEHVGTQSVENHGVG